MRMCCFLCLFVATLCLPAWLFAKLLIGHQEQRTRKCARCQRPGAGNTLEGAYLCDACWIKEVNYP